MLDGYARIAAAVPTCRVADFDHNVAHTLAVWQRAHAEGAAVVVFPELGLSGYTVRDLYHDRLLLSRCERALLQHVSTTHDLSPMALVGLPLRRGNGVYNVAAAVQGG